MNTYMNSLLIDAEKYMGYIKTELAVAEELDMGTGYMSEEICELKALLAATSGYVNNLSMQKADINLQRNTDDCAKSTKIVLEIRAGSGGAEAALFAEELFKIYERHAAIRGWKFEPFDIRAVENGGFRSVQVEVSGNGVNDDMDLEAGVHRVQRIPSTENHGRIHTSTATVSVLPMLQHKVPKILESDVRIDVFHASGHGGQGVNTTDSAVRVTHIPTGISVCSQAQRSQTQNKKQALEVLSSRLEAIELAEQESNASSARRKQIGTGARSECIRTYNKQKNRVSDKRVYNVFGYSDVLYGNGLEKIHNALLSKNE